MFLVLLFFCIASVQHSYGCQDDKLYQQLFNQISHNSITSADTVMKTQLQKLGDFLESYTYCSIGKVNDMIFDGKKCGKIAVNNSYHVTHYDGESLTPLAYACALITCDHRVVEQLCEAGAQPNFKNQLGLYPVTCCLKGLIRLYNLHHGDTIHVNNQLQKITHLYKAVSSDAFVLIPDETSDESSPPSKRAHPAGDIHTTTVNDEGVVTLAVDHKISASLTPDIKKWLKNLCVAKKMRNLLKDLIYCSEGENFYEKTDPAAVWFSRFS